MSNSIVLTRIDDRLIHGQVMTSWLNYTSATKIMVVDDRSAQDPFLKMQFPKMLDWGFLQQKKRQIV